MSRRANLRFSEARTLVRHFDSAPCDPSVAKVVAKLREEIRREGSKLEVGRVRKAEKNSRHGLKVELRSKVYAKCEHRAAGDCESCEMPFTDFDPPEMDHFFGKRHAPENERTCWMLHRSCHRQKTANEPVAAWWLAKFAEHCDVYGYHSEAERARARLDALALSAKSEEAATELRIRLRAAGLPEGPPK